MTSYSGAVPEGEKASTLKEGEVLAIDDKPANVTTTLDVGTGEAVKLDHLGPMVVNVDGTLSQISNWSGMSEIEQKNTLRVLSKRNKERLDALKAQQAVAS